MPRLPLITSNRFGWHGIEAQRHLQPAWETPEHYHHNHTIVIHPPTNCATLVERILDTRRQHESVVNGKIFIAPAQILHKACWKGESTFTLLLLEPDFLAQIAHESVNADRVELLPTFAKPDPILHYIGSLLEIELDSDGANSRLYVDGLTTALSAHLLRQYCTVRQPIRDYKNGLPKYNLKQAINYIQAHLAEDISLEMIATELGMSRYYFCRLFKQSTGISPHQYVIKCRIEQAKELLLQGQKSIAEVAFQVGFTSQSHFTKHFKRLVGVTPKQISN